MEEKLYNETLNDIYDCDLDWNKLKNKSILISGATGMIGKYLVDFIMFLNNKISLDCKIIALGRNKEKARERFSEYYDNKLFKFYETDINNPITINEENIDYMIHAASSTHPIQYSTHPITTITTNVIGLKNILDFSTKSNTKRIVFLSSVEVYGQNRGDVEKFNEDYMGYINSNTLRAAYPESKRVSEALCQSYIAEKDLDIVIARLARIFGPTVLQDDSKASSQFIKNGINNKDIVLKSDGEQFYSYLFAGDAVKGILYIMLNGETGQAYNLSDEKFDIKLKDFAKLVADICKTKVRFEIPDEVERKGYSNSILAIMDSKKINNIGFKVNSDFKTRLEQTINILRSHEE